MTEMENPLTNFSFGDPFQSWWPFIFAVLVGIVTAIRSYIAGPSCPSEANVQDKVIVITGGSSGIGLEVVVELLRRGGQVIVGARDTEKATDNINAQLKSRKVKNIKFRVEKLDVSSLKSVHSFAGKLGETKIDILINNAGATNLPNCLTGEGLEPHFVTNYLSHFLLTQLLLPKLKASSQGRIIGVSALSHSVGEVDVDSDVGIEKSGSKAFASSKLAVLLSSKHMATLLKGSSVTTNVMHPGIVRDTNHYNNSLLRQSWMTRFAIFPWSWLFMKTPKQGAQTIIYLAVDPTLNNISGKYFSDCSETKPADIAMDMTLAKKLYLRSLEIIKMEEESIDN